MGGMRLPITPNDKAPDSVPRKKSQEESKGELYMNLQMEINSLKQRITELEGQVEQEKEFPQVEDDYWYVNGDAETMLAVWYGDDYDKGRLSIDNVFKTRNQVDFVAEKLKVEAELRKFSKPFDTDSLTFTICFDVEENELYSETRRFMNQGSIYFGWGQAEEAMDAVGRERIKKYIFGVVD